MLSLLPEVSPDTGLCINGSFSSDLDPKLLVNPYNSQSGSLHLPKPKSRRENGGYKLALLRLTATERRKLPVTALQRHPDSAKSSESILRAHIELSSGVWDKDAATSMAGKPSRFFSPIVPIPMYSFKRRPITFRAWAASTGIPAPVCGRVAAARSSRSNSKRVRAKRASASRRRSSSSVMLSFCLVSYAGWRWRNRRRWPRTMVLAERRTVRGLYEDCSH
ncbi:hypothetical protein BC830DRAFT_686456 [Chytriomyces sp. MP71]|nr:hypothetical protein BC830DRAFT_686456 [Chytriomyces sp. MP71]